jgi:hypothetical protein
VGKAAFKGARLVGLFSKHAGRGIPPTTMIETVSFLCDQLRGADYLIINRKPVEDEASECDVICSNPGCDSIESAVLPKVTVDGLDRGELVWKCARHRA